MSRNNTICGVGVAYNAKLVGIRLLSEYFQYDSTEARALGHRNQLIDIYSNSWGPRDDGMTIEGPGPLTSAVLQHGITHVRHCSEHCTCPDHLVCDHTYREGVARDQYMCGHLVMVVSIKTRAVQMAMPLAGILLQWAVWTRLDNNRTMKKTVLQRWSSPFTIITWRKKRKEDCKL